MPRYINDDAPPVNGIRTAKRTTPAQLEQLMTDEYDKIHTNPNAPLPNDRFDWNDYGSRDQALEDLITVLSYGNHQISTDLSNIDFNLENLMVSGPNAKWYTGDTGTSLCGTQTLSSGLCFCGAVAGGDWEYPLFYIIYHDKMQDVLRAYIPIKGNVLNCDTLSAFGSEVNLCNPNLPYNLPQLYDLYKQKNLLTPTTASLTEFIDDSEIATNSYLQQYGGIRLDGAVPGQKAHAGAGGFNWDAIREELLLAISVV